jgi:hypothetical protein
VVVLFTVFNRELAFNMLSPLQHFLLLVALQFLNQGQLVLHIRFSSLWIGGAVPPVMHSAIYKQIQVEA